MSYNQDEIAASAADADYWEVDTFKVGGAWYYALTRTVTGVGGSAQQQWQGPNPKADDPVVYWARKSNAQAVADRLNNELTDKLLNP